VRPVHGVARRAGVEADHVGHGAAAWVLPKKGVYRGRAATKKEAIEARAAFEGQQDQLDPSKLVFLDEAGVDIAMARFYGWAPVGQRPVIERPARGRRVTLIGAIGADGPRALRQVDGYVNGEEFISFLREDLGPQLLPGDVVVMDGPSIHKVEGVAEALAEHGATPLYLPPYSPEFNPIEMTWAWLKTALRAVPPRRLADLKERTLEIWRRVSAALCRAWISHCGYAQST
jgi:transposase